MEVAAGHLNDLVSVELCDQVRHVRASAPMAEAQLSFDVFA
jgi:hypothetical protein